MANLQCTIPNTGVCAKKPGQKKLGEKCYNIFMQKKPTGIN
jgi:hypothetical protein